MTRRVAATRGLSSSRFLYCCTVLLGTSPRRLNAKGGCAATVLGTSGANGCPSRQRLTVVSALADAVLPIDPSPVSRTAAAPRQARSTLATSQGAARAIAFSACGCAPRLRPEPKHSSLRETRKHRPCRDEPRGGLASTRSTWRDRCKHTRPAWLHAHAVPHKYIHTYIHTHTHIHTYTHTHIHTYIHTHIHTSVLTNWCCQPLRAVTSVRDETGIAGCYGQLLAAIGSYSCCRLHERPVLLQIS